MFVNKSDIVCSHCCADEKMRYDYHEGNVLCISCGYISARRFIDMTEEYRLFSENNGVKDPRRVGGIYDEELEDGGLGTYFGDFPCENPINLKINKGIKRLKDWGWLLKIDAKIITRSISIYKRILHENNEICRNIKALLAGLLFISAKIENSQIPWNNLENISGCSKNKIYKYIKKNYEYLPLNNGLSATQPHKLAELYAGKMNLAFPLVNKIISVAQYIERIGILEGKTSRNIASVVIFSETKANKSQLDQISQVANITSKTIKNTYDELISKFTKMGLEMTESETLDNIITRMDKLKTDITNEKEN